MDGVRVADDLGLVVADLLQELERELDLDALGDGSLFDLQAGGGRSGDLDDLLVDGIVRRGAGAGPLLRRCSSG